MSKYLSLVANSGQVNTPPGSYSTIKEWIANSFLDSHSEVLEVGCSTGFITIEISRYTRAKCLGIDLHKESIDAAKRNVDSYMIDRASFAEGDASKLLFPDNMFSHVVISGHLPFVPDTVRKQHIYESVRVLKPWGYLLTALYFYKTPPPQALIDTFNCEIGTSLDTSGDYSYWTGLFENQQLLIEYESTYDVLPADSKRIQEYLEQLDSKTRIEWVERLKLFNENGNYLNYFVRVYRKLPKEDKLMLQVPRGGIYRSRELSRRSF